jgi:hypothetical protein
MKNVILSIAILALSFTVKAQTIDTTFRGGIAVCKIQKVLAQWNDVDSSNYLGVSVISDNLQSSATLYWQLIAAPDSVTRKVTAQGNYVLQGEEYLSWCSANPPIAIAATVGCQEWPFYCVGRSYNLTFIPASPSQNPTSSRR